MTVLNVTEWAAGAEWLMQNTCPRYDTNRPREYKLQTRFNDLDSPADFGGYIHALIANKLDEQNNRPPVLTNRSNKIRDAEHRAQAALNSLYKICKGCGRFNVETRLSETVETELGVIELIGKPDVWAVNTYQDLILVDFKFSDLPLTDAKIQRYRTQLSLYAALLSCTKTFFRNVYSYILNIRPGGSYKYSFDVVSWKECRENWKTVSDNIQSYFNNAKDNPGNRCENCSHRITCLARGYMDTMHKLALYQEAAVSGEREIENETLKRIAYLDNRDRGVSDEAFTTTKETVPAYNPESEAAVKAAREIYKTNPDEVKLTISKQTYIDYGYDLKEAETGTRSVHKKHTTLKDYSPYSDV